MYFILFSNYKSIECVKRHKTVPRPQAFYSAGTAPPVGKFLDPPLYKPLPLYKGRVIAGILNKNGRIPMS